MARKTIIFNENQKNEILDLYLNKDKSITYISKLYNTTPNTISKNVKNWGVQVINKQNLIKCSDEQLIKAYKDGFSLTKIESMFNTNRHRVAKVLKAHGIAIVNEQNKTKFNENVFDCIDTEEKAYWLGFIFADGNIGSSRNSFELSLKGSDIEHLYKFNTFMQHNKNNVKVGYINYNGNKKVMCRWSIVNKHLHKTLNAYGCTPNKSLTLKFPSISIFSSTDLLRHFIRGYFDGDGCISMHYTTKSKEKVSPDCSILGTNSFLNSIKNIININSLIQSDKRMTFTKILQFSPNNCRKFLHYLYDDCNIYLNRKFKRANFFMNNDCRSTQEWVELLTSENGESCDANPVVNSEITQGSESL